LKVRPLESGDIESILGIQSVCPEIAQWTPPDYARVAHGEMPGWVCQEEAEIRGFLVARSIGSDIEILNLAVRPQARRLGVGTSLLLQSLEWGRAQQAERAILEVRVSNIAALRFYERFGFHVAGRRPRYYNTPVEDALLLIAHFDKVQPSVSSVPIRP